MRSEFLYEAHLLSLARFGFAKMGELTKKFFWQENWRYELRGGCSSSDRLYYSS